MTLKSSNTIFFLRGEGRAAASKRTPGGDLNNEKRFFLTNEQTNKRGQRKKIFNIFYTQHTFYRKSVYVVLFYSKNLM